MIPKKIHYCWFGRNPLPALAIKCIESWKKYCPDYEIIEWNESNFDINCCDYVKEAYEAKKWAFVSDYARLKIIYEHGGIYLDTDVELINPLDPFLNDGAFFAIEYSDENISINTGLCFGSGKKHISIKCMLDEYDGVNFTKGNEYDYTPCPVRNTNALKKLGLVFENRIQKLEDITVYSSEFFCPMDYLTGRITIKDNTVSIHHFSESWHDEDERKIALYRRKLITKFGLKTGKSISKILELFFRIKIKVKKYGVIGTIRFILIKYIGS